MPWYVYVLIAVGALAIPVVPWIMKLWRRSHLIVQGVLGQEHFREMVETIIALRTEQLEQGSTSPPTFSSHRTSRGVLIGYAMIGTEQGTTHHLAAKHTPDPYFQEIVLTAAVSFALEQLGLPLEEAEVGFIDRKHKERLDAFVHLSTTEHGEWKKALVGAFAIDDDFRENSEELVEKLPKLIELGGEQIAALYGGDPPVLGD